MSIIRSKSQHYDAIGIGIGVFNLSLAALLQKNKSLKFKFFEQSKAFAWHEGMLLDNAKLQVNFLKDLASCVDPSNPYTFLAYLADQDRLYQFLNRKKNIVSRLEFNDYFKWASKRIDGLQFGDKVIDITFNFDRFNVVTEMGNYTSKHIIVGTGIKPYIPKGCEQFLGNNFFHNYKFNQHAKNLDFSNKRVAIIGGGQSGAEIFDTLISKKNIPEEVIWASKRINFQSLEDGCFDNEFYTPYYVEYFHKLPESLRKKKIALQQMTSDGITQELADEIYNKLYEIKYLGSRNLKFELSPNHTLAHIEKCGNQYLITLLDQDLDMLVTHLVDVVILATGYQSNILSCLGNVLPDVKNHTDLLINSDYSINWEHSKLTKFLYKMGQSIPMVWQILI
ncbi:MAG: lysine N(6)-hydroxylase/L-ornithine N(5)-oxygenase family protein [Gammaproteobacteria bacterium]|nr:lysine N(6)-hydroxylase/L-ornithine N(5)-oxygenase family protein [Gammaproteobacteria bacterium]